MKTYTDFINEQARRKKEYTALGRADDGLDLVMKHININDSASKGETPMTEKFKQEKDEERKARTGLSSLAMGDAEAAAVQKTPNRIALADIERAIGAEYSFVLFDALEALGMPAVDQTKVMTIHVLSLGNGYIQLGKSATADIANFDAELGRKFAREDAIRGLWPLFAFALREKLTEQGEGPKAG